MSFTLLRGGEALAVNGWRIPAADVARLRDALALTDALRERSASADARIAAAEAEGRRQGFEAGHAEGRAAALQDGAARAVQLSTEVRAAQSDMRDQLGRLALEVVRRISVDLGTQATLEAVAERAVREVLSDQPLVVHVPEDAASGVSRRLWPMNAEVEVVADAALGEGECVVVSRRGSTRAGLTVQLAALERAFAGGAA